METNETRTNVVINITTTILNTSIANSHDLDTSMIKESGNIMIYKSIAFVVATVTIITNLIVVISSGLILQNGLEPRSCYMLLGNVSLADMLTGISVIFRIIVGKYADSVGMCIFQIGLLVSPTLVSIFSVGLIAVDRYIYIIHGLYYRSWINNTRVRISILFTWIIGLSLGFMPITTWAGDPMHGRQCWYRSLAPPGLMIAFLPIFIVCILYSLILFHALRKTAQLRNANKQSQNIQIGKEQLRVNRGKSENVVTINEVPTISMSDSSSNMSLHTTATIISSIESDLSTAHVTIDRAAANKYKYKTNKLGQNARTIKKTKTKLEPNKWRAIKVVFLTTGSFVCTWCPYLVVTLLYLLCDKTVNEERCLKIIIDFSSPLGILGFLNSILNPIIYAWWHRGFMTASKKIFCKIRNGCRFRNEVPKKSIVDEQTKL